MLLFSWLSRDGHVLFLTNSITSFANSYVSVFFALFLTTMGLPLWQVGLVLTGGLLISTLMNVVTGFFADKIGRRKMLVFYACLTVLSGVVFAVIRYAPLLVVIAIATMLGSKRVMGPVDMLERVILAQSCSGEHRTQMYAIRNMLSSLLGALGFLFSGFPILLQNIILINQMASFRIMFVIYGMLAFVVLLLYSRLSSDAEISTSLRENASEPLSPETKSFVIKLSLLFSMDSFGGGLLTSTLVSYWFFQRFNLSVDIIGTIFFISSLLAAVSFLLATRIAAKIGLIRTMVYSHLPSSIMTIIIPFLPTAVTSTIIYTSRSLLSQMDRPTRQSYTMAVVKPEERTRVGGLINLPRSLTQAISPTIASILMQFVGLSLPFIIAGTIKSIYDIALYWTFKDIRPPEEAD
ncbi:MAG: MFS transporter [Candidatus Bathyarchaeia archaeon]